MIHLIKIRYFYGCIDNLNILDKYSKDKSFDEWFSIVKEILENEEFQKRRLFLHHENESVWSHSIKVSFLSFKMAKKLKINTYNVSVGGLLHDFYIKAWQYTKELEYLDEKYRERFINSNKKFLKKHGVYHPIEALENSRIYFNNYLNERVEDIIVKHMFPLSLFTKYKFPKYKESILITIIDKYASLNILFHIKKYVGVTLINFK